MRRLFFLLARNVIRRGAFPGYTVHRRSLWRISIVVRRARAADRRRYSSTQAR